MARREGDYEELLGTRWGLPLSPWEFPVPGGPARKGLRVIILDKVGLSLSHLELQVSGGPAWKGPFGTRWGYRFRLWTFRFVATRRGKNYEGLSLTRWDCRFRFGDCRFPAAPRGHDYEGLVWTRWGYRFRLRDCMFPGTQRGRDYSGLGGAIASAFGLSGLRRPCAERITRDYS